jgi:exoribonuclease-2
MNVLYEEAGGFKVGTILTELPASLHVEAPHGKRSKIKTSSVVLRFDAPLSDFLDRARETAQAIDVDFLWQCCGSGEFSFEALAQDYYGRAPQAVESAGLLMKLHDAPMYFYKRGRGRYQAASPETLKAALASVEKKRLQAEQRARYVEELKSGRLPDAFAPIVTKLLYAPDRNTLEWKALEAACEELKLAPPRVLARCGAIASAHDYHLNRFLFEHFPGGAGWGEVPPPDVPAELGVAPVRAFSIDDASTTEIDDAFSVAKLDNGNLRIGVHIAAPALGIAPGSALDQLARERLSTVYFPGRKITMLPEAAISAYTLAAGGEPPALSLYVELAPDGAIVAEESRVERVPIAANLRHQELDPVFTAPALAAGDIEHEYGRELKVLLQFARQLREQRGQPEGGERAEYNFEVEGEHVDIVLRERGTPVDVIVSELMIHANARWGAQLAQAGYAAIYRAQAAGVTRLTSVPEPHEGLGVGQYAWSSSPLRRYVDLINQRQLIALLSGDPACYAPGDERLLAAMREFELAYEAYVEFQRMMERYWCLAWIEQENVKVLDATVLRENLVRFDRLPLTLRVPALRDVKPGAAVRLAISRIDRWDLTLHGEPASAP